MRPGYTLVCRVCQKIIMLTRTPNADRPVRWGVCRLCGLPNRRWNYRSAPIKLFGPRPC